MPSRKVVISADGSVIPSGDADEGSAMTSTSSCPAPAPGGGTTFGARPNRRSSIFPSLSPQERIDFFGFSILPMQCLAVVATSLLMLGVRGTAGIFVLFILYQRCGHDLNGGSGFGNGNNNSSRSGNSSRWGERTGSNIKGVSDLPKPPPSS